MDLPQVLLLNLAHRPRKGCWTWKGTTSNGRRVGGGYGRLLLPGGGYLLAHRVSYELFHGPIPDGMEVMHSCDNPPCIRPDHLSIGTHAENSRDAYHKGLMPPPPHFRGSEVGNARLTEEQVREIRSLFGSMSDQRIADRFDVHKATIRLIRIGETWRHVA